MNDRRALALMAAPFVAGVILIVVVPAGATLVLSLFEWDLVGSPQWIGLDAFGELVGDNVFRIALRNSLVFVVIAVPLRLLGALGLALLLHRRYRMVGAYRTAVLVPTVLPDVAYALVWLWIANPLYGPLNLALDAIGAPTPSWLTEPAPAQALVILMSLFTIGEGLVVCIAVRSLIPTEYYEVAAIEGVGALGVFRRITLPMLAPILLLLAMRDAAFAFQATFVPALVVTDGGPPLFSTTYLPLYAYRNSFEYLRYGYGAAITVVMLVVTALVLVAQRGVLKRRAVFLSGA